MAKEIETFIWDEKNECMSEDEREALVSGRIRKCVKRLYEKVPYYKAKLDNAGYCLYFVSRPAESGRKNFRIYSINTPDSMLNARERERRNTFAASIRNLFKQHNKGNIKEYKF